MKLKTLLFGLLIILTTFSCNKKKIEDKTQIFPKIINKFENISENIEKNSKKLSLYQEYNENHAMTEFIHSSYKNNFNIYRYKYKNKLYAYSEFSISKDSSYDKFDKSDFAYQTGNYVIILSGNYIYKISLALCNLEKLKINPKNDIKLPKNKIESIVNSEKLFVNDDKVFPFFVSYVKKESQYKDTIIYTIEPYQKDNKSIKKLEAFIKKQKVTEDTKQYTIFIIEENGSLFLWNKEKQILFLNFDENDLEKIKKIK